MWERSLSDLQLIALDVETTGLDPDAGDRICEIGLVRFRYELVIDEFSSLVNPGIPISAGASAVSGITNETVRDAPGIELVLPECLEFMAEGPLVLHNAPFDLGFLQNALDENDYASLDVPVIDTLLLAKAMAGLGGVRPGVSAGASSRPARGPSLQGASRMPAGASNALGAVAKRLGVATEGAHRALADAHITAGVFSRMIPILGRMGIGSLGDLENRGLVGSASMIRRMRMVRTALEQARQRQQSLVISYRSASGISERKVKPLEVGREYFKGYCHLRSEERTFRIDRVIEWRAS